MIEFRGGGHPKSKLLKGFTMAEVLITLGILGVVIAMTLPALIAKHHERVWLTEFQRVYTTLYQAYYSVYTDYGTANEWGIDGSEESLKRAYDMLAKYLNVGVEYGFKRPNYIVYKDLPNDDINNKYNPVFFKDTNYNFTLSDGALIGLSYDSEIRGLLLHVDINGEKGPNVLGKDLFYLSLVSRKNAPAISGWTKWWIFNAVKCTQADNNGSWYSGGGCSLWVIATGNMDYLHREITLDEWQSVISPLIIPYNKDGQLP